MKVKLTLQILVGAVLCALCSCANQVTVRTTEATADKPASETILVGTAVAAKQEAAGIAIETGRGTKIMITGSVQDSDDVPKAGVNWWGLGNLANIQAGVDKAKDANATSVQKEGIKADVQKTEIGAGVVNNANDNNAGLEALSVIPKKLPR